jgi:hypothetical protein
MTPSAVRERLSLYLPRSLVEALRRAVPPRQRSEFVAEALAQSLHRLQLKEAIAAAAGCWSAEDHPELATGEDIDRWIAEGRADLGWDRPIGGEDA